MVDVAEPVKRKADDGEQKEVEPKKLKTENGESKNGCSDLDKEIIKQIEYYFGDINLPRDKFMLEQIKSDDGWIPMSVMFKFQRLAKLTTDPKALAAALAHSQLMEVKDSEDEPKIRRSPEMPLPELNEERRKEIQERTLYCKGFPLTAVMDDVIKFFAEHGPVENIIMRKYKEIATKNYKFKGSVFATFVSKDKAQAFLDIEDIKYGETVLIRKWQLDYIEAKKKELLEMKLNRKSNKKPVTEKETSIEDFPRGTVLHLTGDFSELTREDMKQALANHEFESAFINFNKGDTEAHIRLVGKDNGKKFIEKVGKEIEIVKSKLEARLLEGEEEEEFLKKAKEDRDSYLKKCHQARQGGRRGRGKGKGKFNDRGKKQKNAD